MSDWPHGLKDEQLGALLVALERFERFRDALAPGYQSGAAMAMSEAVDRVREECAKRSLAAACVAVYGSGFRSSRPANVPPSGWAVERRAAS